MTTYLAEQSEEPYWVGTATSGGWAGHTLPCQSVVFCLDKASAVPERRRLPSSPQALPTGSINNNWTSLVHLERAQHPGGGALFWCV